MSSNVDLQEKLKHLPLDPGVYLMKNAKNEIVYVGKAKSLRNRVRSYFVAVNTKDLKTKILIKSIKDFDIIITKTETEALLLERTLIRHHHPNYNVRLKDGKEYPYIRINFNEPWPRVEKVRRRVDDGAFYVGPFSNVGYLTTSLKLAGKIFPLIRCTRHEFKTVKRPCNYYHMKMCLGPCKLPVERQEYVVTVRNAVAFLMGNNKELAHELKEKMQAASAAEDYELAALLRDQLQALTEVSRRQATVVKTVDDADAIGVCLQDSLATFHVLMIREGKVIGGESFLAESPIQNESEALQEFMLQYYDQRLPAREIFLPVAIEDMEGLVEALGPRDIVAASGRKITLSVPKRGPRFDLVQMATKNALYHFEETERQRRKSQIEIEILQEFLGMDRVPHRLECIDISNLQATALVASNVCFIDGKPAKEFYRHYTLKSIPIGVQDDYASIEEVVRRRLARGVTDGDLPDLLVIDGGKGQLQAAHKVLLEFPQVDMQIISLAKARLDKDSVGVDPKYSYERVFAIGSDTATPLKPGSPVFRLLTHLRDEAHRFAIGHHRKKRAKIFQGSELDEIAGIGPTLRRRLLEKFAGLEGIKNASLEELMAVKGIKESVAVALHSKFRG